MSPGFFMSGRGSRGEIHLVSMRSVAPGFHQSAPGMPVARQEDDMVLCHNDPVTGLKYRDGSTHRWLGEVQHLGGPHHVLAAVTSVENGNQLF
jgi:hypothetical protein